MPEPAPAAAASTTAAPAPAGGQYAQPSSNAAEVEVEEITTGAATPGEAGGSDGARDANDSSGAADAGGAARNRGPSEAGVVELTAPPGAARDDLVGPAIEIGARTTGEQVEDLDAELERQMAAFDERMRRARAAAEAEQESGIGGPTGAVDGAGYRETEPDAVRGAGGAADRGSGLGNTPDLSGAQDGQPGRVANYPVPGGVPDGRDDDIVARQLREAAEREADPVLREKLWDEYRKYKTGR